MRPKLPNHRRPGEIEVNPGFISVEAEMRLEFPEEIAPLISSF